MIDFTPGLRAEALEVLKRYKVSDSPFTPPVLGRLGGILGAIGAGTATNWPGSAADPEQHVVYAQASNAPSARSLVEPTAGFSDIRYVVGIGGRPFREVLGPGDCCAADGAGRPFAPTNAQAVAAAAAVQAPDDPVANTGLTVQGLPIYKPPYGVLSAINLERGVGAHRRGMPSVSPSGRAPKMRRSCSAIAMSTSRSSAARVAVRSRATGAPS